MKVSGEDKTVRISESGDVAKVFQGLLLAHDELDVDQEHCWVMHLSARHQVKQVELVALGSLNVAHLKSREVFRRAIIEGAATIILGHNHPSGEPIPSDDDIAATRRLHESGELLGIPLLDHVIVTRDSYYSFRQERSFPSR